MEDKVSASIPEADNRIMKFHGSYRQDDRDLRLERQKQKLEPAYQFMVRVRAPGGVVSPEQYLVIDELAHRYGNETIRLTTRQAFQLYGIRSEERRVGKECRYRWSLAAERRKYRDTQIKPLER